MKRLGKVVGFSFWYKNTVELSLGSLACTSLVQCKMSHDIWIIQGFNAKKVLFNNTLLILYNCITALCISRNLKAFLQ